MDRIRHHLVLTAWCGTALFLGLWQTARAAEHYQLREDPKDARVRKVAVELKVNGKLFPSPGPEQALKLNVDAQFGYHERRLSATGRDAESLRCVRYYDEAKANINAGDQFSSSILRKSQRLIVSQGQVAGLEIFSPAGPLTYSELELLHVPTDSLAIQGLLTDSEIDLGETWTAPVWSVPLVTGVEAVEKGKLTCKLEKIDDQVARIGFTGDVTGATVGASSVVELRGHLLFDREQKLVTRIEATQTEKRAIGAVSPGLDVTAKVTVVRSLAEQGSRISDKELSGVPLEPNAASRLLLFESPVWNVRLYHDRNWHVFHQASDGALLRLLDQGGFISQCNIKKLPNAEPGQHLSEKQFQQDIQQTLGKNFEQFLQAEKLNLKDGLFIYRVVAAGSIQRTNEKKEPEINAVQWINYLVANPEGRQLTFVFSVDARQVKDFGTRDVSMVAGIEFLRPRNAPPPAPAEKPKAK
ncbi:MAG: hypothetical protein JSS02_25115 [Planctomycetes bacterium]|nr:hypothetical protein [Planctomycetota bacterium]